MQLEGKVALVTGASRGIGKAIALAFAEQGADVLIHYCTREGEAHAVMRQIRESGRWADCFKADLLNDCDIQDLARTCVYAVGHIDILVNNAGIVHRTPFGDDTVSEYDSCMALNVRAPYLLTRALAPSLAQCEGSSVLNIGSVAGIKNRRVRGIPYGMSKASLHYMTGSLARTLAPKTRVNCIAPSYVATDLFGNDPEKTAQAILETPLRRLTTVEDVAHAAVYLSSDSARNITGSVFVIDGGISRT